MKMSSEFLPKSINLIQAIKGLKEGTLDPIVLSVEMRDQCIGYFNLRHVPKSQIASLLKISARTVRRRIKEVKKKWGADIDEEFVLREIGLMLKRKEFYSMLIFKEIQAPGIAPMDKIKAIYLLWKIEAEKNEQLRRIGIINVKKLTSEIDKGNKKDEREELFGNMPLEVQKETLAVWAHCVDEDLAKKKRRENFDRMPGNDSQ
jgi:DNA-binding Lrp family transcriptional regulator